jgi:transcriptional regulator GlxA family with amidase domain
VKRRELLQKSAAAGLATTGFVRYAQAFGSSEGTGAEKVGNGAQSKAVVPLKVPASGEIHVAHVLSVGVVDIDFTGPWAIFGSVMLPGEKMIMPFRQYTVAEKKERLTTDSGLMIVPEHNFETAPQPNIIVIPAQGKSSDAMVRWIRETSAHTDVTTSVCVGSFTLAKTGLLDGKSATTHHQAYDRFATQFPNVHLERGVRFVDEGNLASAGGLACGMDLAMHIVERYYGPKMAQDTAYYLEYQGTGWKNPASNSVYATAVKR